MKIVAGYDGTQTSERALAYAVGHALRSDAELVVAWIDPGPPPLAAVAVAAGGSAAYVAASRDTTMVDGLRARLAEADPALRAHVNSGRGDAANELERIATEQRADLLVIGRSRMPARHILGSVAGRLVRNARCPVVVVP